jgi:hypothetical protein
VRSLPDRLEALEDLDRVGAVFRVAGDRLGSDVVLGCLQGSLVVSSGVVGA